MSHLPLHPKASLAFLLSVLAVLVATALARAWTPEPDRQPPTHYQVTLPAPDREARTRLASQGVAIDAVGPDRVVTIVDADGLAWLEKQGLQPIAVTPLDFPPADAAYHNYDEMVEAIQQADVTHPDILRVTSVGFSLEGRPIPAVKISDEPDTEDPAEPDILFMALTHAREHLTVEMALAIIRWFTEGYGVDPALTNLVEQREIWVLPNVNPDGGEYDIADGYYRFWRKNRRLNPDGSYGVDLNRNYGYRWGCCGGSSPYPHSETYRGPAAFSEPETQAVRDFVLAHPDIRVAISFHTYSELILYPYGYTYDDLPPDMDLADYQAFVALAQEMAATNGYLPAQASDLYITSGDAGDWLYGELGIFGFTFEMYPKTADPGFYPPADVIERETTRNQQAVIYLTAVADNPRKVIGLGGDASPPQVSLAPVEGPIPTGQPVTLEATATDDQAVTLVAWQVDGQTAALQRNEPYRYTWSPDEPGLHIIQVRAFDAGGNEGTSEAAAIAVLAPAEAQLHLPDPPVLELTEPLSFTFSRPITGSTLRLRFDPPIGYTVVSGDGTKALVLHAPFQPSTIYHLTLEGGCGPDAILPETRWTFWSRPWRLYLALGGAP